MNRTVIPALVVTTIVLLVAWYTGLLIPLLLIVGAAAGSWVWHKRHRSAYQVNRWGRRAIRKHGVASTLDILRFASFAAMRHQAAIVRPSFADTPCRRVTEVAVPLVRIGLLRAWSSIEDVIAVFGGPRTGKSGYLGGRIIDAPGAVVSTSTRLDLLSLTRKLRARKGPVLVFNPVGLGKEPNTVAFDPLHGCEDPTTAIERAHDMLPLNSGSTKSEREHWVNQGRRILAVFMHAAALGDLTMFAVQKWVSDPKAHQAEIARHLKKSPEPTFVADAVQFANAHDGPRTSIATTIMPALMWLTRPSAVAATIYGDQLDVRTLLETNASVYLLGAKEAQTAPLVSALTGYIAREARRLAALAPAGRLDPPLTLVLDEAAVICPVPLDSWSADMGGRGVTIIFACQSRAQLIATYGETGAAAILNNTSSILVFGGTRDDEDLKFWAHLAGNRDEQIASYDKDGHITGHSTRSVPVIAPAQFANLPGRRVVCFRRGMAPVVGRAKMCWRRWDVRLARWQRSPTVSRQRVVAPAAAPAGGVLPTVPSQAGDPVKAQVSDDAAV